MAGSITPPPDTNQQPRPQNKMAANILLAGLFHETHTFLPGQTEADRLALTEGEAIFEKRGDGSPIDGFLEAAADYGWNVLPLVDLRGAPGPTVADSCFEDYWQRFLHGLNHWSDRPWDAVFLVLHGAMCTASVDDVEGELLRRIRREPSLKDAPVFAILDLHANVSPAMAEGADALIPYRKNPHTDARETAVRGAALLRQCLATGMRPSVAHRHSGFLLAPLATGTATDPMRELLQRAEQLEAGHPGLLLVNVTPGYSYADTEWAGLVFTVVHQNAPEAASEALEYLGRQAWPWRTHEPLPTVQAAEAFRNFQPSPVGPTVFVEVSDNIGGGTWGDATGALRAMLEAGVRNAALVINDPEAVAALSDARPGDTRSLSIGGRRNPFDTGPLPVTGIVRHQSNGLFTLEDLHSHLASMYGKHIDMGPSTVLEVAGVQILLTTHPIPPFDLGQLRSQGIVPEKLAAVVVKAAVGHRQAWDPIAASTVFLDTPGPCPIDLRQLPFRRLRRPIFPLDS